MAYSTQQKKENVAVNTGVMFFSASTFKLMVLPNLLKFGSEHSFKFGSFDESNATIRVELKGLLGIDS